MKNNVNEKNYAFMNYFILPKESQRKMSNGQFYLDKRDSV